MSPITTRLVDFIRRVGIPVSFRALPAADCFLPGILIEDGVLVVDPEALKYPGDLLHEAGHIAVVPAAERSGLRGPEIEHRKDRGAEEMMAMAWSYAAARHLELDPEVVFHAEGYKGESRTLVENFGSMHPIGVPMLHFTGMSRSPSMDGAEPSFPVMQHWLRP